MQYYAPVFLALYSAQRFFVASIIRFLPAALSLRFLPAALAGAAFAGACVVPLMEAHRLCCASLIRARVAALNLRFLPAGAADAGASPSTEADLGGRPLRLPPIPSIAFTCCICSSTLRCCASKPASAAFSTSALKRPVCIGM